MWAKHSWLETKKKRTMSAKWPTSVIYFYHIFIWRDEQHRSLDKWWRGTDVRDWMCIIDLNASRVLSLSLSLSRYDVCVIVQSLLLLCWQNAMRRVCETNIIFISIAVIHTSICLVFLSPSSSRRRRRRCLLSTVKELTIMFEAARCSSAFHLSSSSSVEERERERKSMCVSSWHQSHIDCLHD